MSGGVDSSVAAARLLADGHKVTGVTMQLLPEDMRAERCRSSDAVRVAKHVCDLLAIPHQTIDLREAFEREVVEPFVEAYATGFTPNPCIDCNTRVKFARLLTHALSQGAEYLATGHYARIVSGSRGEPSLARASDASRDQSYFLYRLTSAQLKHLLFPLGHLAKEEVRRTAAELGLPSAARPDSQEACFVPSDVGSFVVDRCPAAGLPGPIIDTDGERIGTHRGIAHYTVGQRKGLGLPGGPWYVAEIRTRDNSLVVTPESPPNIVEVVAGDPVWQGGEREVVAMLRYRMKSVPARVVPEDDRLIVTFASPVREVASGQAVVCYEADIVLGGGVILEAR